MQAEQLNEELGAVRPKYLSDEDMAVTIKTLKTICDILDEMETHS
jgi:DNA-binding Xre family transcriptional regulator